MPHSRSRCEERNIPHIKLAYASDIERSRVIGRSVDHGEEILNNALVASLEHGMWFYKDMDASLWCLQYMTWEHSHNECVLTLSR